MKLSRMLPFVALAALAACSGNDVTQTLGLDKEAPDEFVVVSRPPLSVPPEFDLTPPRPGEEPPHAPTTESQARRLLLGTDTKAVVAPGAPDSTQSLLGETHSDTPTLEEFMGGSAPALKTETALDPVVAADPLSAPSANFLKQAGADAANTDIRTELRRAATKPKSDKPAGSLFEEMMGDSTTEPVVDPAKEAERLRANKDEGKPVTEGDTPTEDTTKKSVLDRIF